MPFSTSETALLEIKTNITFVIDLKLREEIHVRIGISLKWVVHYIKPYLSYPRLFQYDLMLFSIRIFSKNISSLLISSQILKFMIVNELLIQKLERFPCSIQFYQIPDRLRALCSSSSIEHRFQIFAWMRAMKFQYRKFLKSFLPKAWSSKVLRMFIIRVMLKYEMRRVSHPHFYRTYR